MPLTIDDVLIEKLGRLTLENAMKTVKLAATEAALKAEQEARGALETENASLTERLKSLASEQAGTHQEATG